MRKASLQLGPDGGGGASFNGDFPLDGGMPRFEESLADGRSPGTWSVVLPGTPDALPYVRQMVTEAATRCGFGAEEIAKIEMAVDEACTNIIEHAYQALNAFNLQEHLEIEVHANEYPDRLEISILDHSHHNFPVHEHAPEELDHYFAEQRKRGLGLYIISSFVDDVKHRFVDGQGNELLLVKYFV